MFETLLEDSKGLVFNRRIEMTPESPLNEDDEEWYCAHDYRLRWTSLFPRWPWFRFVCYYCGDSSEYDTKRALSMGPSSK